MKTIPHPIYRRNPQTAMNFGKRLIGNSVCPPLATAIVRANMFENKEQQVAA